MIVIPYHISRTFVQEHREFIFLYANDAARKGMLGQAWIGVGQENCFPISTVGKLCPSHREYFNDLYFDRLKIVIDQDIANVPEDGRPIIPFLKIGEGCSRMKELAPQLFHYMTWQINNIKYPEIKYDYGYTMEK